MEAAQTKFIGKFDWDQLEYLKQDPERMTAISLFSGAGGAALGVRAAGYEIRVMVEFEKAACNTLRMNWVDRPDNWREILRKEERHLAGRLKRIKDPVRRHVVQMQDAPHYWWQERPPAILEGDIKTFSTEDILKAGDLRVGECTLLEAGFPCQGFSTANSRRDGSDHTKDERNFLYQEAVRVMREAMPKFVFLENVPGLVSMEKGAVIRMICNDLATSGYSVSWDIHNAADYGVPQNRRRVLIMCERQDVFCIKEDGTPQLHIGGMVGRIHYPKWFEKKYPV